MTGGNARLRWSFVACAALSFGHLSSLQAADPQPSPTSPTIDTPAIAPSSGPAANAPALQSRPVADAAVPAADDARVQKVPSTPLYAKSPAFAHGQCANTCQRGMDAAIGQCREEAARQNLNANHLACVQRERARFLACTNACPGEAARLQ
jgi:hypothetical protein